MLLSTDNVVACTVVLILTALVTTESGVNADSLFDKYFSTLPANLADFHPSSSNSINPWLAERRSDALPDAERNLPAARSSFSNSLFAQHFNSWPENLQDFRPSNSAPSPWSSPTLLNERRANINNDFASHFPSLPSHLTNFHPQVSVENNNLQDWLPNARSSHAQKKKHSLNRRRKPRILNDFDNSASLSSFMSSPSTVTSDEFSKYFTELPPNLADFHPNNNNVVNARTMLDAPPNTGGGDGLYSSVMPEDFDKYFPTLPDNLQDFQPTKHVKWSPPAQQQPQQRLNDDFLQPKLQQRLQKQMKNFVPKKQQQQPQPLHSSANKVVVPNKFLDNNNKPKKSVFSVAPAVSHVKSPAPRSSPLNNFNDFFPTLPTHLQNNNFRLTGNLMESNSLSQSPIGRKIPFFSPPKAAQPHAQTQPQKKQQPKQQHSMALPSPATRNTLFPATSQTLANFGVGAARHPPQQQQQQHDAVPVFERQAPVLPPYSPPPTPPPFDTSNGPPTGNLLPPVQNITEQQLFGNLDIDALTAPYSLGENTREDQTPVQLPDTVTVLNGTLTLYDHALPQSTKVQDVVSTHEIHTYTNQTNYVVSNNLDLHRDHKVVNAQTNYITNIVRYNQPAVLNNVTENNATEHQPYLYIVQSQTSTVNDTQQAIQLPPEVSEEQSVVQLAPVFLAPIVTKYNYDGSVMMPTSPGTGEGGASSSSSV